MHMLVVVGGWAYNGFKWDGARRMGMGQGSIEACFGQHLACFGKLTAPGFFYFKVALRVARQLGFIRHCFEREH